jgi:hypothetical protein
MLQRGRSHHGQVIVVTQSAADPEALTGQPGLLASLTDNFTGFAIHRQNAPETRDWLAKLMGTTAIWQSTDQTTGHGAAHSGRGSRRRVRQFRIGADTFAELGRGEAIIHSTLGGQPQRTRVLRTRLPRAEPDRIGTAEQHACEIEVHPTSTLDQLVPDSQATKEQPKRPRGRRKTDPEPTQTLFEADGV